MCYYRVSTRGQAERDLSIPDQRRHAREFCTNKSWSIIAEFEDPGRSGRTAQRPELTRMMESIFDQGVEIDVILIHSFSRFFRDAVESELYIRKLAKRGIRLLSITQDFGDGPMGELIRRIFQLIDEYQSQETAKHVKRTMLENARNGFLNGSRPPFGYWAEPAKNTAHLTRTGQPKKRLAVHNEEAELVKKIFELYLIGDAETGSGPLGIKAIVSLLNTKRSLHRGAKWSIRALHDLLRDPVYAGQYWYNWKTHRGSADESTEEIVKISCPNIVSYEIWKETRAKLETYRPRKNGPGNGNVGTYILRQMIKCPHCSGAMMSSTGKGGRYRYYACAENAKKGTSACQGFRINADQVEHMVLSAVQEDLLTPTRIKQILLGFAEQEAKQEAKQTQKIAVLQQRLDNAQREIDNLFAAVKAGLVQPDDSDLKKNLAAAQNTRDEAKTAIDREAVIMQPRVVTPAKIDAFVATMRRELGPSDRSKNPQAKHAYLRATLDAIVVKGDAVTLYGKNDSVRILANAA